MTTDAKRAESREMPVEIDLTSSNGGVYVRKNIVEETREDNDGNEYTVYCYDEMYLTHAEYERYLITNAVVENIQLKHENDIIDSYTLQLFNEGVL